MGPHTGEVNVEVLSVKHAPKTDLTGKCDPYCIVESGSARFQTEHKKKTYDADFNEIFKLVDVQRGAHLKITLMDWDRMSKDDYIGEVTLSLDKHALAAGQQVLKLVDTKTGQQVKGYDGQFTEVHVHITGSLPPEPSDARAAAPAGEPGVVGEGGKASRDAGHSQIIPRGPKAQDDGGLRPPPATPGGTKTGAIGLKFKVRNRGLVVEQVKPGGPCERAGLRPGDVIEAVNGERIQRDEDKHTKPLEFYEHITGKISGPLGSCVELRITRPPPKARGDRGEVEDKLQAEAKSESFTVKVAREIPINQLNPPAPAPAPLATCSPDMEAKPSNERLQRGLEPQGGVGAGGEDAEGMLRQWMADVKQAPQPNPQVRDERRRSAEPVSPEAVSPKTQRAGSLKTAGSLRKAAVAGTLAVRCVGAVGLPKMDTFTQKADPYLVLCVADVQRKTSVKKKTLEPVWDETLDFECVAGKSVLRVEMFDHETVGKDRSMGSFAVPITAGMQLNKQFPLEGTLADKRSATGFVELALVFQASTPAPFTNSDACQSATSLAQSRDLGPSHAPGEGAIVGAGGAGGAVAVADRENDVVGAHVAAALRSGSVSPFREMGKLSGAQLPAPRSPAEQIEEFWRHQESKQSVAVTTPEAAAKTKINRDSTSTTWSKQSPTDVTDTRDFAATDAELLQMVALEDRWRIARRIGKSRHTIPWEECPEQIASQGLISLHKRKEDPADTAGWRTARSRSYNAAGAASTPRTSASMTPRMTGVSFSRRHYMSMPMSGVNAQAADNMSTTDSDVTSLASHRAYATEAHLAGNNLYGHKDSEAQGKERLCSNGFSKDYGKNYKVAREHARMCGLPF